jgi:galactofuranosylgalactofuranosylrhamnosyl-N-acetylglucosaminyl-diphospho-decaprenol beta-1,5/1,6-galactofuranosyltransferase
VPPEPSSARPDEGTLLARVVSYTGDDDAARSLYRHDDGSFASYFDAFPASYWQRWSVLSGIELRVRPAGSGELHVWRSDAEGRAREVATRDVDHTRTTVVELPLEDFDDGGWYWFDLSGAETADAGWWAPAGVRPARSCRASLGITTLNREQYVIPLLRSIAAQPEIVDLLDRVFLIDHGSRRVRESDGFDGIETAFGGKLTLREQANIGGSGGFSRSMLEAIDARSDAVIILDDDVALDPESLRRMIRFEEFARTPMVVGGHMFDMRRPSRLLAMAEGFRMDRFLWNVIGPGGQDLTDHDFRATPWLHRRSDAQYTGWWMCLIPTEALRVTGLSLPFFIKWDDAEYGLRAAEHGYPTVTLPGAAVWHVSWDDKDDTVDWQAYFHSRNRLIAALVHSPLPHGGKTTLDEFLVSVKNLFALEYGAQAIRNAAYRDLLAGPDGMHEALGTKLQEVRALLTSYDSGRTVSHDEAPTPTGPTPRGIDALPSESPRGWRTAVLALPIALRNLIPARRRAADPPQAELPFRRTKWWINGRFDSVLVATADGSSDRWLRRDSRVFFALLLDAWRLTRRIRREWPELQATYKAAASDLVSIERWRETTSAPVGR